MSNPIQHFMWVAFDNNNQVITEFNTDGTENLYKDLPRKKIVYYGLQSPRASYFIDLKNGVFHLKDHRLNKKLNIILPVNKHNMEICGYNNKDPNYLYNFHHYKKAHQDFNIKGQPVGVTVIDEFLLGWTAFKNIPRFGPRYLEATLSIQNIEAPKPVIKVYIRREPNGKPIEGSPYEIAL
jgi:hypothetical protein